MGDCPVMNAARPAVQLCWPYQSVNSAPSLRDTVDVRRLVAHHAHVVGADVEAADVVAPDDEDVGFFLIGRRRRSHKKYHDGQQQKRNDKNSLYNLHVLFSFHKKVA